MIKDLEVSSMELKISLGKIDQVKSSNKIKGKWKTQGYVTKP